MVEIAWYEAVSCVGMLMEHEGWGVHKFDIVFAIFPPSPLSLRRRLCAARATEQNMLEMAMDG